MPNQPTHTRPPLWRQIARSGRALGSEWRPVEGPPPEHEPPAETPSSGEAEIIEGDGAFELRPVGGGGVSRFRFFLDGIERARVIGYFGAVPVVHGYVAAVIRERRNRSFRTWAREETELLAFSFDHLPSDRLTDAGVPRERLEDAGVDDRPFHPLLLVERGRQAVKNVRERLERRLALAWARERAGGEDWLLVDGSLALHPDLVETGRAIGLVKSHRTQFLDPAAMRQVLASHAAERSPVFRPVRPDVGRVYSWYLRLREPTGRDIYWALARIEGAATDRTLEAADDVSRWLLHETAPLALPDPRWDVLLYPIRDCESYLRARMPALAI